MIQHMLREVYLISIIIIHSYCYSFECDDSVRTIQKASDVESNLNVSEYLPYLNCESNYGNAGWELYTAQCLANSSCVGIRTTIPPELCTLANETRNHGNMTIEDL